MKLRFGLRHLLAEVALICTFLALLTWAGRTGDSELGIVLAPVLGTLLFVTAGAAVGGLFHRVEVGALAGLVLFLGLVMILMGLFACMISFWSYP
ncbi:MAG: hypothetical protein WD278_13610 [Pirellulales bacterium]